MHSSTDMLIRALRATLGSEPAPVKESKYGTCPHCHEEIGQWCQGCERITHVVLVDGIEQCAACRGISDPDGSVECAEAHAVRQ